MTLEHWLAESPPEVKQLLSSVPVKNFIRDYANRCFQSAGAYDGAMDEQTKDKFRSDYQTATAILTAARTWK